VHALSRESVEIERHGGDEALSLARGHFGDFPLVEDDRADELAVVGHHVPGGLLPHDHPRLPEEAAADVLHDGEGFGHDVVERLALFQALSELVGLAAQFVVGKRGEAFVYFVYLLDIGLERSEVAVGFRAEYAGKRLVQ